MLLLDTFFDQTSIVVLIYLAASRLLFSISQYGVSGRKIIQIHNMAGGTVAKYAVVLHEKK